MKESSHLRLSDVRGLRQLASEATVGVTDLVEAMHLTVARTPGVIGRAPQGRTAGITGLVYKSVRGVTRLVGGGLDALLGALAPLESERRSTQQREAVLAAVNGVLGDHLAATRNPLQIEMRLRSDGTALLLTHSDLATALPGATGRVLVLAHGLCMNDQQWRRDGNDLGATLARELGYTPVYLHYNSGLHISANGREFATLMETLVREWPLPIERLAIAGHSMGGLVARSACDHAARAGHGWTRRLDDLVFLGTPHFGAPLARAGTWADYLIGISPYTAPFARLGKTRSAGIMDLQHGYLRDEEWQAPLAATPRAVHTPLPLPQGVRCFAIAASSQARPPASAARPRGDGLVPVASALGRHADPGRDLGLPESRRWIGYGIGHVDLLGRTEVHAQVRRWLADPR